MARTRTTDRIRNGEREIRTRSGWLTEKQLDRSLLAVIAASNRSIAHPTGTANRYHSAGERCSACVEAV